MDISFLRAFITTAHRLNFTEAAKQLFIAQSVLSRQISVLEKELGVQLFIRSNRTVRLTPAGLVLLQEVEPLMDKLNDVFAKSRTANTGFQKVLRLGCFGVEYSILPVIIKKFSALYPNIRLDFRIFPIAEMENALKHDEFDIGFTGFFGNEFNSNFMHLVVSRHRVGFLLPPNHPYTDRQCLNIADMKQESFILIDKNRYPQASEWFYKHCEKADFIPKVACKSATFDTMLWQVKAGLGVAIIGGDPVLLRMIRPGIHFIFMSGKDAYGNIAIIWNKNNPHPAIPLFIKEIDAVKLPSPSNLLPVS
ncbi:LysR family transcriptional regulator [Sporomusa acidovorans]|uniref:HTH-type transcriptional regulator HdfR n=1 Tax=Sporomusa acidovorans (strain ATCC 49682 / DSM 3132 / Mol) TaxID=1123286 RepID=A0ABZ3J155_SPOA4|nr:LysR family transcriptional regulator [Sporomusa acidovorans]OZC21332.1 HTH-type transcriptional regulator GltC [Sporomusa acidovorans DSM 3132]SDE57165.1 transcriptional regulator, LysR family [Sporomusa acidovorans]